MRNKVTEYKIIVYCEKCGNLITEGKVFHSRSELQSNWDAAILSAPLYLPPCSCSPDEKPPHLEIEFKIRVTKLKNGIKVSEKEYSPKAILPKQNNISRLLDKYRRKYISK